MSLDSDTVDLKSLLGNFKDVFEMTSDELRAHALQMRELLDGGRFKLKKQVNQFKIGEKGGVSVYGLGRFPVTLYREQWERLFEMIPAIKAFIDDNQALLKSKAEATRERQEAEQLAAQQQRTMENATSNGDRK